MVSAFQFDSATGDERVQPAFSQHAITVLEKRYLRRDHTNTIIESPTQLLRRVAHHVASAEASFGNDAGEVQEIEDEFYEVMARLEFLPNSPTLRNAGVGNSQGLSACFVVPITDSLDGIMEARRQAALIIKFGGGVGFDFSQLRPEGERIQSTHQGACGPIAVMRDFDLLSDTFTQAGGSFRKGALMEILRCDHPDIFAFVHCKDNGKSINNANISVAITNDFIEALSGRGTGDYSFDLVWGGNTYRTIDARDLWQEIAESAHKTGDPGLFFVDRVNGDANPLDKSMKIVSTNPCGEQALGAYESCNLGSIDVAKFITPGGDSLFDWARLAICVRTAVRFLDDVVEINAMPTPETRDANLMSRRIGLGIMGWADALIALKIPYASKTATDLAGVLMSFVQDAADDCSLMLGQQRGTYRAYAGSTHEECGLPFRNAFRTTQAPTGTLSLLADCSSGIEPVFARTWTRTMEDGTELRYYHPAYQQWLDESDGVNLPEYLETALEIDPYWHVAMQAAFQNHVDNAISKTVGMVRTATVDDVKRAYQYALEMGCKGITVYRDGSRDRQILTDTTGEAKESPVVQRTIRERLPDERVSITHKFSVGDQEGYFTVGHFPDGRPGEIFVYVSKQGSTINGLVDAVAVLTSMALQHGVPLSTITRKLRGTHFEPSGMTETPGQRTATSILDYIFTWMERRYINSEPPTLVSPTLAMSNVKSYTDTGSDIRERYHPSGTTCTDCGSEMHYSEGCLLCLNCGQSKCG